MERRLQVRARVTKLVDVGDLKSLAERRAGSSPALRMEKTDGLRNSRWRAILDTER